MGYQLSEMKMNLNVISTERQDGALIRLIDILNLIPDNNYSWSILEYEGIGGLGINDFSFEQVCQYAQSNSQGFILNFNDLKVFASTLHQTLDCLIVASKDTKDFLLDRAQIENFYHTPYLIEVWDGYEWLIGAQEALNIDALE
ncbi:hypothetical protein [Acinetobacter lanii]|uniref:Uncharacterized protein n=1 Tax=Acinetobacter lanii TaxID=2715163 RepID=A0A6G8S3T7_9GAMM|nr:hypothetical protein [Acinetobacter lanii]QIO08801.1 hypothetical protein G8D99_07035 [Acinetobacter lanii]